MFSMMSHFFVIGGVHYSLEPNVIFLLEDEKDAKSGEKDAKSGENESWCHAGLLQRPMSGWKSNIES